MAFITQSPEGHWVFGSGKHAGKTLETIAREDPNYLQWVWREPKVYGHLPDNAAYALEDAMVAAGIPLS